MGQTRDDAAGEAFDKVGKLLQLPYPGGPEIDQHAKNGDPARYDFPRSMLNSGDYHFSFSGLKTSVANYLKENSNGKRPPVADLCASFQEAVSDVLVKKTIEAAKAHRLRSIVVGGGVAANRRIRAAFQAEAKANKLDVYLPDLAFCTDNAAMIAAGGYFKYKLLGTENRKATALNVDANLAVTSWSRR